jgi:teichuronic acid biosynthesis glycosyltransferase TuaG
LTFSIIIPVFNCENYIEDTILSILNQTFTDFEVIIIDDMSTDKTIHKIAKFLDNKRVSLYKLQNNMGPSSARNYGIRLAKGNYIAFLDSDDLWSINYLKNIVIFTTKNPNVDIVVGKGYIFTNNNLMRPLNNNIEKIDKKIIFSNSVGSPSGVCIKKYIFKTIGFPTELRMFEDFYLYLYLIKNKYKFVQINNYYYYRKEGQNTSSVKRQKFNNNQILKFNNLIEGLNLTFEESILVDSVLLPYKEKNGYKKLFKFTRLLYLSKILRIKYFNYIATLSAFYLYGDINVINDFKNMEE